MKEIEIRFKATGKRDIIYGLDIYDAIKRHNTIDKLVLEGNWYKRYSVPNPNPLRYEDIEVLGIWDEVE